ncbi:Growth-regulating factor 1 [Linum grandiflorum]
MENHDNSHRLRPVFPCHQSESSLSQRIPTVKSPPRSSDPPTIGLGLGLMTGSGSRDEDDDNHDTDLQLGKSRLGVVFTVSQLQELHLQWTIYRYIEAGVRVPHGLLVPIWNTFHSAPPFVDTTPTLSLSWTPWTEMTRYKKGVGEYDEPGRCRRTDGKKWRCSKESLPDQKYCQKHMNRGRTNRNRSRKHVESADGTVCQTSDS